MQWTVTDGVNEDHEPSKNQEKVIDALRQEKRANPKLIHEVTGLKRQRINEALGRLVAAGWVRQPTRGLYEYVDDPRVEDDLILSLSPDELTELANILDECDRQLEAEYNTGHNGARSWADRLREEGSRD